MPIPDNIKTQHILNAIKRIDLEGIPPGRNGREYVLDYGANQYPCKLIISWANIFANNKELKSGFFNTYQAQNYLKQKGFIIKKLHQKNINETIMPLKKAIWISYDFGLKGDYTGLYTWLDNHKAVECGNGLAFFFYDTDSKFVESIIENIASSLRQAIKLSTTDRLYLICKSGQKVIGEFINGTRKQAPWEGYGEMQREYIKDTGE